MTNTKIQTIAVELDAIYCQGVNDKQQGKPCNSGYPVFSPNDAAYFDGYFAQSLTLVVK